MTDNEIISLPYLNNQNALHFGSSSNYERLVTTYFIQKKTDSNEIRINKHIVMSVEYSPDNIYAQVDGMWGKCWLVTVADNENNKLLKYHIRNWGELVNYYQEQGLAYVQ